MKRALTLSLLAAAVLTVTGCDKEQVVSETSAVSLPSGIDTSEFDPAVNPADDLFGYVNNKWLARTEIPADRPSWGTFSILDKEATEQVLAIIEEARDLGDKGSDTQQQIGNFYRSYIDWDARNAQGIKPIEDDLASIQAIQSQDDLARYLGYAQRYPISGPFGVRQGADDKNPDFYTIYITQHGLGLPNRDYYLNDDDRSIQIRGEYVSHVEAMLSLAGIDDSAAKAARIMALETRIAQAHLPKEAMRNPSERYNKMSVSDLPSVTPNFNWGAFLDGFGLPNAETVVLYATEAFEALTPVIDETSLEDWKAYLQWTVIDGYATRLTQPINDQNFAFFGTILSGVPEQRPLSERAVTAINQSLGEVVGQIYVARHFPPEAKAEMTDLVANLVAAYRQSIASLEWMGEDTRVKALEKLERVTTHIGYPDKWRDYASVTIAADDYFGNRKRLDEFDYQRLISRHDKPVDKSEWWLPPQTVNAWYSASKNAQTYPAAILQPPFFTVGADPAVNYGGIGMVIAHELSHGFDDAGSQYAANGLLTNWWSDSDRENFEARTDALVAQYDSFYVFDDLHVNGRYTLGENIGDLGGMSIAALAYEISLAGEEAPVIDGMTGMQRFFLGAAQSWRIATREEYARRNIATDVHSPARFRVNGPVRNIEEFYEAFDVEPQNALYLPPEQRVKIWRD